jgi:hypothetical protein
MRGRIRLCCRVTEHVHRIRLGFDAIPDRIDAGADEGMCPFVAAELIELHHADAPGREPVVDRHVHGLIVGNCQRHRRVDTAGGRGTHFDSRDVVIGPIPAPSEAEAGLRTPVVVVGELAFVGVDPGDGPRHVSLHHRGWRAVLRTEQSGSGQEERGGSEGVKPCHAL